MSELPTKRKCDSYRYSASSFHARGSYPEREYRKRTGIVMKLPIANATETTAPGSTFACSDEASVVMERP
jgi:hypothetical protein